MRKRGETKEVERQIEGNEKGKGEYPLLHPHTSIQH